MLKKITKLSLLIIVLLLPKNFDAQCVITFEDYTSYMEVGKSSSFYQSPLFSQYEVNIGEPSSNPQVWDFTSVTFNMVGTSESIDPVSAPYISFFPQANYVLKEESNDPMFGEPYEGYSYIQCTNDRAYLLGVSDDYGPYEFEPYEIQFRFPSEYGAQWTEGPDTTEVMPGFLVIISSTVVIDAFGTLKLPIGDVQALRFVETYKTINISPVGIDTSTYYTVSFNSKEFANIHMLLNELQPTIIPDAIFYNAPSSLVSVEDKSDKIPGSFTLYQNYPNPFNPSTKLRFYINEYSNVIITIYNSLGQKIDEILKGSFEPGTHEFVFDGSNLTSGIYFYEIKSNENIHIKKMTLLK